MSGGEQAWEWGISGQSSICPLILLHLFSKSSKLLKTVSSVAEQNMFSFPSERYNLWNVKCWDVTLHQEWCQKRSSFRSALQPMRALGTVGFSCHWAVKTSSEVSNIDSQVVGSTASLGRLRQTQCYEIKQWGLVATLSITNHLFTCVTP